MKYLILVAVFMLSGCAKQYSDEVCLSPGALGEGLSGVIYWQTHCKRFAPKAKRSYGRVNTTTRINGRTYRSSTRVVVIH